MKIEIDGFNEGRLEEAIAEQVSNTVHARVAEMIEQSLHEELETQCRELVREKIRPVLEQILAEGWQPTDDWGTAKGPKVTLKDRLSTVITQQLDKVERYDNATPAQKMVVEAVREALKGDIGAAIERARVSIKEQVDGLLNARMREAVANALGLKV